MSNASAAAADLAREAPRGKRSALLVWASLAHAALWIGGAGLLLGNLHADTLEAIYWGADWALGYAKHPPVTTWFLDAALHLGAPPIVSVLIASQATVAVAAYFTWRTVRLFGGPVSGGLGLCLFLAAPAASIFAVQVNHNIVLAPFWAASMFFGLRYLERRRTLDSCLLGVAAGIGLITKYEIAFILATLVVVAAAAPRYRTAFAAPASYLSLAIMAAIAAPHVWWLAHNDWESVARAVGVDKVHGVKTLIVSAANALSGQAALFAAPALLLLGFSRRGLGLVRRTSSVDSWRLGALLAFTPSVILLAGAVATDQVVKPLWAIPLASSVAAGLALMFPPDENAVRAFKAFAGALVAMSAALFAGFLVYLFGADAIGKPVTAYEPQARVLSAAVEREWRRHQQGPLDCLVIADRKLGPSPLLWLRPMPHVVDYSSGFWHGPRKIARCLASGGMIVDASRGHYAEKVFPRSCSTDTLHVSVPARFGFRDATWPVDVTYAPPNGIGCGPAASNGGGSRAPVK